jgi:Kef-type K+ transport system membrane component KefB
MPLMITILLLLVVSRIAGEIFERYKQPAMIGEMAAGVILGPSLLNLIHFSPELKAISDLGVLLLVLLAGMEIEIDQLLQAFRGRNIWVSVLGFGIPLAIGIFAGNALGFDSMLSLFLGLCVAITALPVSVRILMDLGKINSDLGKRIIFTAIADDVVALLILGVIFEVNSGSGGWYELTISILLAIGKALLFMGAVITASRLIRYSTGIIPVSNNVVNFLITRLKGKEPLFGLTLLFVMVFAGFSEAIGLHFVVGAFFGSMLLSYEMLGKDNFEEVRKTASSMTMGFLAPLFFAAIGLEFDVRALIDWQLIGVVLAAAVGGKVIAGLLGGRLAGLKWREGLVLGIGLNGRGIMELVIANIALASGFINQRLFSVLVLMGVVTTLVTPSLLKYAFGKLDNAEMATIP